MKKRFTDEQMISILKEQEAGERTADVCRRHALPVGFCTAKPREGYQPSDLVQVQSEVWRDALHGRVYAVNPESGTVWCPQAQSAGKRECQAKEAVGRTDA